MDTEQMRPRIIWKPSVFDLHLVFGILVFTPDIQFCSPFQRTGPPAPVTGDCFSFSESLWTELVCSA